MKSFLILQVCIDLLYAYFRILHFNIACMTNGYKCLSLQRSKNIEKPSFFSHIILIFKIFGHIYKVFILYLKSYKVEIYRVL